MDLLNRLEDISPSMLPVATLLVGLFGSLHCVGMCGPLVVALTKDSKSNWKYQVGRLLGYMSVSFLLFTIGLSLKATIQSTFIISATAIFMGSLLIFYGFKILLERKIAFHVPASIGRFTGGIYRATQPFVGRSEILFGFSSIFLPCGFLYGVVLITLMTQNPQVVFLSVILFWLGTLPSLILAPKLFFRIMNPLKQKAPIVCALILMSLGLITIFVRINQAFGHHICT